VVDVVMLGHSDVGKTTYISSMYQAMQAGARGFTLRAAQDSDHRRLMSQASEILHGRFPPGSDRAAEYPMMLRHSGNDIFPVTWHDHRGGALTERSSSQQTASLLHRLETADGFLMFGDAPRLLESDNRSAVRSIQDLVTHVLRVIPGRWGRTMPLVIVITKIDLVGLADRDLGRIVAPFEALMDAVQGVADVHLAVAPVACGPMPRGVLRPVLWTLCFGLIAQSRKLADSVGMHLSAARAAAQQDTVWSRWKGAIGVDPWLTPRSIVHERQDRALHEWSYVMPLIGHAVQLLGDDASSVLSPARPATGA
jgi:hypothetical protein